MATVNQCLSKVEYMSEIAFSTYIHYIYRNLARNRNHHRHSNGFNDYYGTCIGFNGNSMYSDVSIGGMLSGCWEPIRISIKSIRIFLIVPIVLLQ